MGSEITWASAMGFPAIIFAFMAGLALIVRANK